MPAPELQLRNKEWRRGEESFLSDTLVDLHRCPAHSIPVALMHALLMSTVGLEPRSYFKAVSTRSFQCKIPQSTERCFVK